MKFERLIFEKGGYPEVFALRETSFPQWHRVYAVVYVPREGCEHVMVGYVRPDNVVTAQKIAQIGLRGKDWGPIDERILASKLGDTAAHDIAEAFRLADPKLFYNSSTNRTRHFSDIVLVRR